MQDVTLIGLFTIVATVLMKEQLLTTSAVGAVVVGFALQDTLGNLFSGLAIQIEKPFRVGHWIAVGAPRRAGAGDHVAGDEASDQGGSVPDRAERHDLERGDPQLLRADHPDAIVRRGWHQLHDAAQ